jgi:hypothetical protein
MKCVVPLLNKHATITKHVQANNQTSSIHIATTVTTKADHLELFVDIFGTCLMPGI